MSVEIERDFVCDNCGSAYRLLFETDKVTTCHIVQYCSFCGEESNYIVEEDDYSEEIELESEDSDYY